MLRRILFLLLIGAGTLPGQAMAQGRPILRGDVNHDGKVSAEDALLVLSSVAGRKIPDEVTVLPNGDADADERLTVSDILMILKYSAGRAVGKHFLGTPVYRLLVDADTVELVPGGSRKLIASVAGGKSGVSWHSASPSIAAVDGTGVVKALAAGSARVTATLKADSTRKHDVTVRVLPAGVASLVIAPSAHTFSALGEKIQLTAKVKSADGKMGATTNLKWKSTDDAVARVAASGLVTSVGVGTATISASSGTMTAEVRITVGQTVHSVVIAPKPITLRAIGDVAQLSASAKNASGSIVSACKTGWASRAPAIATVSASGKVTAQKTGHTRIIATCGSASDSVDVTVGQTIAALSVAPSKLSLAVGDTAHLRVSAADAQNASVSVPALAWSSSDPAIATVDGSGVVRALKAGAASITVKGAGQSATVSAQISATGPAPVGEVSVFPTSRTFLALGDTLHARVTTTDADGKPIAGRAIHWTSSDAAVASVDSTGLVTARGNGAATINAVVDGKSAVLTVDVAQAPKFVRISPSDPVLDALGATLHLSAAISDANGHVVKACTPEWKSLSPGIATISASGSLVSKDIGETRVIAGCAGVADTVSVTVRQVVTSISITSAASSVQVGNTVQLSAAAVDAEGTSIPGAIFT